MGSYKLTIVVDRIDNVYAEFEEIEIWRSTTGLEVDRALFHTITLVEGQSVYEWDDNTGEDTYVAWFRYHHDTGDKNSAYSPPRQYGTLSTWYTSIQDIRDEGITEAMLSNDRAAKLIDQAQSFVDLVTGRHFLPVSKVLKIDSEDMRMLRLPEPIVKIDLLEVENLVSESTPTTTEYDHTVMRIYNRHLTMRLIEPGKDDRKFPRIMITPEFWPDYRWLGSFPETRQQIKVTGVFGYTELRPSDEASETSAGSQVPTNWGRCPPLIQDAMVRLIARWIAPIGESEFRHADEIVGKMKSWKTDKQSVTYHGPADIGIPVITGDMEIDSTLFRYSAHYSPDVDILT